ncbi:NAD(P)-dependent oxidoreductase [Actinophytocola sp.]|uniref:NAD(P)-dependent oxidoreductase n=1 Tax=Actinophytocola sp. TaxID=1872138 RepID=UPI002D42F752|nr:NAD(P)-dependent oxidoreductase [Actinophytocola sp.]HYQ65824.1 NAD(P)-dependent oxidoreductase [Actinophytocola sp.]
MTRIAFIGLGIMGLPMAVNLVRAGHEVTGHNRSPARTARFAEQGGRAADSVRDAVAGAEIVITMLPDSPDVEAVAADVLTARRALWVDMSTISPVTARSVAAQARDAGLRTLDAPVSGGEQGAVDGTLSIMVGGEAADVEAARPVLEVVGRTIVHVGPAGAGQTVKAANQLIVAGTIGLVAEALTLLDAQGVDLTPAVEVLSGGLAGSAVLDRKSANMLRHEFAPGFRVDLHHKDLGIALGTARESGVPLPLGAVVAQLMAAARAQGHGDLDHSALLLVLENLAGGSRHGR